MGITWQCKGAVLNHAVDSTFKTRKPVCWLGERIFTKSRALVTLCSLMDMETIKCQSFNYIGVLVILTVYLRKRKS